MLPEIVAKSGEAAKSGPIGLAVILILCILCYFLFKSMSKHLRTVRENYSANTPAAGDDAASAGPEQRADRVVLDKPRPGGAPSDEQPPPPTPPQL
jgi:hypothetical protein